MDVKDSFQNVEKPGPGGKSTRKRVGGPALQESPTNRQPVSSIQVEKALLHRIAKGEFKKGDQLPTCRVFSQQTGVNKNTVSKAYRSLEEQGYLQTLAGKGTFVIYEPFTSDSTPAIKTFNETINQAVWQAKAAGMSREQVVEVFNNSLQTHYDHTKVRAMLLECNAKEAQLFADELGSAAGIEVHPVVMTEFVTDVNFYLQHYDLISVTLNHLSEVEDIIKPYDQEVKVIGVNTAVMPDSLLQIARLPKASKTGVVCTYSTTVAQMLGTVQAYNHSLALTACLDSDEEELSQLIENVDWIVATQTSYEKVSRMAGQKPVIAVEFKIDQQSQVFFTKKVNSANYRLPDSVSKTRVLS
ncbi:MAG: hypothetical protein JWP00_3269 [Chloroflexi bacterium]|jgi:GntR family transcriptional regulator|nr:hypothetical protein [Chloroflexota bacterium]